MIFTRLHLILKEMCGKLNRNQTKFNHTNEDEEKKKIVDIQKITNKKKYIFIVQKKARKSI